MTGVVGDRDGHARGMRKALRETRQLGAATGQHDPPFQQVHTQLGRGAIQDRSHGGNDTLDGCVEGPAQVLRVNYDTLRQPVDEVTPTDLGMGAFPGWMSRVSI